MVIGVEGEHVLYNDYRRPPKHFSGITADFDGYHWLKPAADLAGKEALTLYDLRKLRFGHAALTPDWERIAYGYDLLVLIPRVTPADLLQ